MHSYQMDLIAHDLRQQRLRDAARERLAREARAGAGRPRWAGILVEISASLARAGRAITTTGSTPAPRERDTECAA